MKRLLLLVLLFGGYASYAQNDGFPYDDLATPLPDTVWKPESKVIRILREFRFQSYIQPEWQRADTAGATPNGGPLGTDGVGTFQGGTFPATASNRFLLRRARFRFSFEHKNAKDLKILDFAFQFDAYDYKHSGGTVMKEAYGRIIDPWVGWFGLQAGIFVRPFGMESTMSPAFIESPEFSRVNQTVLPNESELGAALVIESPAKFEKVYLRLDACVVNGQGIGVGPPQTGTFQNRKDFIGRIKAGKMWKVEKSKVGVNASLSYYNGGALQTTNYVYQLQKDSTGALSYINIADPSRQFLDTYKREYIGAHVEVKADYPFGITTFRGEFIAGTQPGGQTSSQVPTGQTNSAPATDLYLRKFNGAMFYLNQSIKQKVKTHTMMHDVTLKYDWYDPQKELDGKELTTFGQFPNTDIKYSTFGAGYTFTPYNWFKLMIWYDHVMNEETNIAGWTSDFSKDDVLTIRMQFYVDTWWFNPKSKYKDNLMAKKY